MTDTEKLSEQLYDKALNEMNAFLDDLKPNRRRKSSKTLIKSLYGRI